MIEDKLLKLFKALPIEKKSRKKNTSKEYLEQTIKKGFIVTPDIIDNYDFDKALALIDNVYGLDAGQMNSSFHKSWGKVKNATDLQLIVEQAIHYLTTYGFEELGIYSDESVYIPKEELNVPDFEGLTLIVIKGLTKLEIKEKIIALLNSGIALKEDTLLEIADVINYLADNEIEFTAKDLTEVKNKEAKIFFLDKLDIVPENPNEFLRFMIYKLTGKTLIIKSHGMINLIKETEIDISSYFLKYKLEYGLEQLSSIFLRYKPIFLAMKKGKLMKRYINKLRKLAIENHKPMNEDYLNSVTMKISRGIKIDTKQLNIELSKVNVFRKIRLLYALKYRTIDNVDTAFYRIRNGKSFAKYQVYGNSSRYKSVFDVVKNSIVEDLSKNVKGKKIYIPEGLKIALPSSQKQYTGVVPSGTSIDIEGDMIVGVHWFDVDRHRIDLDLSMIDSQGMKIGWDAGYRNELRSVMFSGDVTSAPKPNGASELFYVKKANKMGLMMLNYFNHSSVEVPYKIMVGHETPRDFKNNYMINPNNVKARLETKIVEKQMLVGLVESLQTKNRFYFVETSLGKGITSSDREYVQQARRYLINFYKNMVSLNELLELAGAEVVTVKNKVEDVSGVEVTTFNKVDLDLSIEALEKDTIINLLSNSPQ